MSASYIHRDRLLLHQADPILKLPLGVLDETRPQDSCFASLSTSGSGSHHSRLCDELTIGGKLLLSCSSSSPSPPPLAPSQVSLRSPKMSPDSTLTTHSSASHFPRNSPPHLVFGAGSSSASSSTCESFLRTALLSDCIDRSCVGSSSTVLAAGGHHLIPSDPIRIESARSHSPGGGAAAAAAVLTASSHISSSPSTDPLNHTTVYSSIPTTPLPSSTTGGVKKSSRRNPWGPETYSDLITVAIHSYPDQQATLQQIYDFIITHYDYFRDRSDPAASAGWKNSIRHNLSLHDRFTKCPKSSDNTKSSYWRINTEVVSKPYVRRRACSMDGGGNGGGGGMKRSSGCGKSGRPTGACGSSSVRQQSGRHHEKLFGRTIGSVGAGGGGGLHALPELPPETYSSQTDFGLASGLSGPEGMLFHHHHHHHQQQHHHYEDDEDEDDNGRHHHQHPANPSVHQKLSAYFGYGSNGQTADNGGSLWPPPLSKPSTATSAASQSNYSNPVTTSSLSNRPYPYEQLSGSSSNGGGGGGSFDFHSTMTSTDQGLVRSRANSLIEHLLRADIPSMNLTPPGAATGGTGTGAGAGQRHTHTAQLSQAYLPNAFFTHHPHPPPPVQLSQSLLLPPSRLVPPNEGSSSPFLSPQPPPVLHPVDMRQHQTSRTAPTTTTATTADNPPSDSSHLRALYLQTNSALDATSASATFGGGTTPWSAYYATSHLAFSNPVSPYSPYLADGQPSFPSFRPTDRSMDRVQAPFMTGCLLGPASPSTNSSTSSSTRSWRPPCGLHGSDSFGDVPIPRSTQHHKPSTVSATTSAAAATTTTSWLGRSGGAFQPCSNTMTSSSSSSSPPPPPPTAPSLTAASLYYASELFNNPGTCALDTPPYSHVKPEPLDTDMTTDDTVVVHEPHAAGGGGPTTGLLSFSRQRQLSGLSPGTADMDVSTGSLAVYQHHHPQMDPATGLLLASTTRYHAPQDYGSAFSDVADMDRDSMELELSLELAERIVNACARSGETK